ncbi:MAG TPA: 50S ribosomal protein L30 [Anaerolineae bacterium]|nr:50S ribosomal protein L30 [Anaerolineae bacterium]
MAKTSKQLQITWVKSSIGYSQDQKATIKAMGFRRLGQKVVLPDNPSVRGMVHKVKHLVEVQQT